MKALIWFPLYCLASAACDVKYAVWSPDDGDTIDQDLSRALPGVGVKEFKILNPKDNPNKIFPGTTYTIPYNSERTVVPPAIWSGNCPRTLLLRGGVADQDGLDQDRQTRVPTPTGNDPHTSDPSARMTGSETTVGATSVTGTGIGIDSAAVPGTTEVDKDTESTSDDVNDSQSADPSATRTLAPHKPIDSSTKPTTDPAKATDPFNSKLPSQATDVTGSHSDSPVTSTEAPRDHTGEPSARSEMNSRTTATEDTTYVTDNNPTSRPAAAASSTNADPPTMTMTTTAAAAATEKGSPDLGVPLCWRGDDTAEKDSKLSEQNWKAAAKLFCHRFVKVPLTAKDPSRVSETDKLVLGAHVMPACTKSELDEVNCWEYLDEIEERCPDTGGYLQKGCYFLWIAQSSRN